MRKISTCLLTLMLLVSPLVLLRGSNVIGGEKITIDQPVDGNVYVAAGELLVRAPINGDFVAAGGQITVQDIIGDEGLVAGGEIIFEEAIRGDLRVAGGQITVRENVDGDLVVMGGEVEVAPGVEIGGDLILLGGEANIQGNVSGIIRVATGEFTFKGIASGGLRANGGELTIDGEVRGPSKLVAQEINLGSRALFFGDVRYYQPGGEVNFGEHLRNGATATYDPTLKSDLNDFDFDQLREGMYLFSVYRFIAGIFLIVLLVLSFHHFFQRHSGHLMKELSGSLGYGALYLIGVPVLAILAFITIIGIPVGFILGAGYGITLILAGALVATVLAYELEKYLVKTWSKGTMILVAIGISLLIRLINFIPVIGGIVMMLVIAVVFGYLFINIKREGRLRRRMGGAEDIV